ncbi:ArdC-like ssDNA-binding domain-containing protein [Microbacterium tumbae]
MARVRRTAAEAAEAREAKLELMGEKLEAAVEALTTGEDWTRAMEFAARFRSRSFRNTLLIYVQHLDAYEAGRVPEPMPTYVAGFNQWKELGRSVDKGQSGYMIYAPVLGRFASPNPQDPMSWRRLAPREKPATGEVVRSKIVNVKPAYVWDASQTSGADLPERPMPRLLEGQAPEGLWDGLAAQVDDAGFALTRAECAAAIGGANGVTYYDTRIVTVRGDMDEAAQVKTLAHELGHVRMHDPAQDTRDHHRGVREVEAESVAMMIGAAHGLDTTGYTIPYVASWANAVPHKTPVEVVRDTGERVRKIALDIVDRLPDTGVGDGYPPGLTRETGREGATRDTPQSRERVGHLGTAEPTYAAPSAEPVAVAR